MNTVAAIPEHLRRFAAATATSHDRLHAEAGRLANTLHYFSGQCREYAVPHINGLSDALFAHCRAINEMVEWVRTTADRLEAADRGTLQRPSFWDVSTVALTTFGTLALRRSTSLNGPVFDIGARVALRVTWQLRSPPSLSPHHKTVLRVAACLAAGWTVQKMPPLHRWWLNLLWPGSRTLAVQSFFWQVSISSPLLLPWQPLPIAIHLLGSTYRFEAVMHHLQQVARELAPSLRTLGWMMVWEPALFRSIVHRQIAEVTLRASAFAADLLWQHWQRQARYHLTQLRPFIPSQAQMWRLLNQSMILNTDVMLQMGFQQQFLTIFFAQIGAVAGLSAAPRLPEIIQSPTDILALTESGFWIDAFQYLTLAEMRELVTNLEQLDAQVRRDLMLWVSIRPAAGPEAEPDGQAVVTDVFPPLEDQTNPQQPYRVSPAALQANAHGLISSYYGEEVRAAQVGKDEFAIGINGLSLNNMPVGTNGLVSVIDTVAGKEYIEQNRYYQTVIGRVLRLINELPEGSTLHLTGHSMGGGMCILLSNDPRVQAALAQRNIQLASVTTLGAVRPQGEWDDVPPVINGQPVTVRHYVDSDDKLALSVGAGHQDEQYRDAVYMLDNNRINQPMIVHGAYQDADYTQLPETTQTLPFTVDPTYFRLVEIPPLPFEEVDVVVDPLWA